MHVLQALWVISMPAHVVITVLELGILSMGQVKFIECVSGGQSSWRRPARQDVPGTSLRSCILAVSIPAALICNPGEQINSDHHVLLGMGSANTVAEGGIFPADCKVNIRLVLGVLVVGSSDGQAISLCVG